MIDFYDQRKSLEKLKKDVRDASEAMRYDELLKEKSLLAEKQKESGFWGDVGKAGEVNKRITSLNKKIGKIEEGFRKISDCEALADLVEEMGDESEIPGVLAELEELEKFVSELRIEAMLGGKYDSNNAILTLHAGAGGTEAMDWTEMLFRMYSRYAERKGYKTKVLDRLDGEEAGIKNIAFLVSGDTAYGYLKAEMGVHRLVRISPFDANKRRHTSFASLEVMPEITDADEIKINPEEIRIDTYRSSGAGGQHINKTDSAVRITHIPTGTVVQCQNERSQIQNRETAMKLLLGKLTDLKERERLDEAQSLKGELKKIEWGSQIRSYVFCPYTMVKDHRTGCEMTDVAAVMDGDIEKFIIEFLKRS